MTNEEIWEWMQRDLDGDLSLVEQDALYNIIRKDSDLQLKYNRLKTVSQQLEQLPPVVPSFSIVDSILPRLESAAAVPAASSAMNEEILPTLEVKRNVSSPSETKKWKRMKVWLASIGSTAVAACLLIGIMFAGSDGKKNEIDPYQQGSDNVTPATTEKPALVGPPPPTPSTNPSTSNPPEEEKKAQSSSLAKKQTTKKVSKPNNNHSVTKPVTKPAATTPAVPPTPVVKDPKPPAFPFGLEENSDKDDKKDARDKESGDADRDKSKEKSKEKQNDDKKEKKSNRD
ncbi:hypothetical protein AN963_03835 [Brevibacillus choshinensis]|uniref:Anti-sigma factor n=1 Tax=Brevibacillus choshinensis TaxID=54911 RepID=A0ABR5NBJ5_BRECH|nr:hypothetical protein [Brevibacillus choshinensis]KQL48930.1 hypothetical protein AN963_03835 [Brevibacillus choshinensis]